MEHLKFLENAREAAYCLHADLLTLAGLMLFSVIPTCNPAMPRVTP